VGNQNSLLPRELQDTHVPIQKHGAQTKLALLGLGMRSLGAIFLMELSRPLGNLVCDGVGRRSYHFLEGSREDWREYLSPFGTQAQVGV
jgi:hypothetical protein